MVTDLNKIMQLSRNIEGNSMNAFDRRDNVECTNTGVLISNPSS